MATARCTWDEVSGVDGYNVYLKSSGEFVKQNSELITEETYDIEDLAFGEYEAYATSVIGNNESEPSNVKGFEIIEPFDEVEFVAAGGTTIGNSSSINVDIPSEAEEGDYLVLHVVHRDTLTTPTGWTILEGPTTPIDFSQRQTVLYKIAEEGDGGTNVSLTQGSSQRFLAHIQAFRCDVDVEVVDSGIVENATGRASLPEITADRDGCMACVSQSFVYALTSGDSTINPPNGYTQTTPVSVPQNRLGCAYKTLDDNETISGQFSPPSTTLTNETAFSLILGPEIVS
jgi:hypothetical protein